MKRRDVLAGIGVVGIGSLAGCLGTLGLDEHVATPASVESSVLAETGYERTAVEEVGVEREVGAAGFSEEIAVTNYVTEHDKAVELEVAGGELISQRAATFIVLTTPQIGIAGQEFNPVEEMSTVELIDLVQDNYDDISNVEHEADEEVAVLGETTTQSRFTADAQFDGIDLDVNVHVSEAVETTDDLLVTIGVYPRQVQSEEEENVLAMMEAVIEDADIDPDEMSDGEDTEEAEGDGNETGDEGEDFGDEIDGEIDDELVNETDAGIDL